MRECHRTGQGGLRVKRTRLVRDAMAQKRQEARCKGVQSREECRRCESMMGERNDKRVQSRRQRSSQVVVYREQRVERRFGEKGSLF